MHDDWITSDLLIKNGFYFCVIETQINRQTKGFIIERLAGWWFFIDNLDGLYVCITQMHFFSENGAPTYFDIGFIDQYLKIISCFDIDIIDPKTIT